MDTAAEATASAGEFARLVFVTAAYKIATAAMYVSFFFTQKRSIIFVLGDSDRIDKNQWKVVPPPASKLNVCEDPVAAVTQAQMAVLDPNGERKALFDYRRSMRSVKPGDIIRVTFKSGDPFSGVVLSIRSRGVDTSVLLRNQLTRVGVEMSIKVFSPNVEGVEIVQRTEKRKRRARIFYMRYFPSLSFFLFVGTNWIGNPSTILALSRVLSTTICAKSQPYRVGHRQSCTLFFLLYCTISFQASNINSLRYTGMNRTCSKLCPITTIQYVLYSMYIRIASKVVEDGHSFLLVSCDRHTLCCSHWKRVRSFSCIVKQSLPNVACIIQLEASPTLLQVFHCMYSVAVRLNFGMRAIE